MEEKGGPSDSDNEAQALNAEAELDERTLFINNLPIDTNEEEIDQIYSRCGPVESIQLFNLRPELDPGRLSNRQLQELRRKKKFRSKAHFQSYNESQHQRPRTPVYGILRFQSAEGYQVATSPELCIFGCVIRRHPVLSIKHSDLTTLHIEQIPTTLRTLDVEYKLAQLLHPHNVYITQDGMRGVGIDRSGLGSGINGDHMDYAKPSSCQVNFEDFHTASQAYQLMRSADGAAFMSDAECQVHWFRTPENSMEYWTRQLSF